MFVKLLNLFPQEDDWEFQRLTKWEQGFLPSVRKHFTKNKTLTNNQYQQLERIWDKLNR